MYIGFGLLLSVVTAWSLVRCNLDNHNEAGRWIAECLNLKSQAIDSKSPKLVLLAGSNALFGYSARVLSEEYAVTTVNASVHAGLELNYILHYGRKHFKRGRIFILPLEYQLYGKQSFGEAFCNYVLGYDSSYFRGLSFTQQVKIASAMSMESRADILRAAILRKDEKTKNGYQSETLNAWGDETNNEERTRNLATVERVKSKARPKFYIDETSWNQLEVFIQDANKCGCQVVMAYPNIYAGALDIELNRDFFSELNVRFLKLGVPVLGTPAENAFSEEFIFDTTYHQTTAGQHSSTERLFWALKAKLGSNLLQTSKPKDLRQDSK